MKDNIAKVAAKHAARVTARRGARGAMKVVTKNPIAVAAGTAIIGALFSAGMKIAEKKLK